MLLFGFLLGFTTCLALIGGVIYFLITNILDFPGADGKTELERKVENDMNNLPSVKETNGDLISKVFQDPKRRDFFSQERIWGIQAKVGEESCEWFNFFIQRIFMEYVAFQVEEKIRQRINAKFATGNKPKFLGKLHISKIDAGSFIPYIFPIKILAPKVPQEMRAEADISYEHGFTVSVDAELWLNLPTKSRAMSLPVSLTVKIERLAGRVLLVIPPGPDPLCTLGFYQAPFSKFSVVPGVGVKKRFGNIPALSSFIVNQIQKFINKDLVLPLGICFHLPLKNTLTTGRDMNPSTVRKMQTLREQENKDVQKQSQVRSQTSQENVVDKKIEKVEKQLTQLVQEQISENVPEEQVKEEKMTFESGAPPTLAPMMERYPANSSEVSHEKKKTFGKLGQFFNQAKDKIKKRVDEESKYLISSQYKEIKNKRAQESVAKGNSVNSRSGRSNSLTSEAEKKIKEEKERPKSTYDWVEKNSLNIPWDERNGSEHSETLKNSEVQPKVPSFGSKTIDVTPAYFESDSEDNSDSSDPLHADRLSNDSPKRKPLKINDIKNTEKPTKTESKDEIKTQEHPVEKVEEIFTPNEEISQPILNEVPNEIKPEEPRKFEGKFSNKTPITKESLFAGFSYSNIPILTSKDEDLFSPEEKEIVQSVSPIETPITEETEVPKESPVITLEPPIASLIIEASENIISAPLEDSISTPIVEEVSHKETLETKTPPEVPEVSEKIPEDPIVESPKLTEVIPEESSSSNSSRRNSIDEVTKPDFDPVTSKEDLFSISAENSKKTETKTAASIFEDPLFSTPSISEDFAFISSSSSKSSSQQNVKEKSKKTSQILSSLKKEIVEKMKKDDKKTKEMKSSSLTDKKEVLHQDIFEDMFSSDDKKKKKKKKEGEDLFD